MEKEKLRYSVSRRNFFVRLSSFLMFVSAMCILLNNWGFWTKNTGTFNYTQVVLPIGACILFSIIISRFGKKAFSLTFVPVAAGAVFFIFRSTGIDGGLHRILCIAFYIAAAIIYMAAVFGMIRTKWILTPLFGLPLLYRIFVEDKKTFFSAESAMSIDEWLAEISILCILLAMFLITFAMKKRSPADEKSAEQEAIDILLENEEPTGNETEGGK